MLNALRVPMGAYRNTQIVGHDWDRADCTWKSENRAPTGKNRVLSAASHTCQGHAIGVNNVGGYLSQVVDPNCNAVCVFSRTRIIDVGILVFFPDRQMRGWSSQAPQWCQLPKSIREGQKEMVGPNGFEPSTSSVSRKRSRPTELRAC